MKIFGARGYQLSSLPIPAKLVYTFFLTFIALGIWTSWRIYAGRVGFETRRTAGRRSVEERYVSVREVATPTPPSPQPGAPPLVTPERGPAIELDLDQEAPAQAPPIAAVQPAPTQAQPADEADPKTEWVIDVLHQHLFSVSVVWLILAHLLMLTRLVPWLRGTVVTASGLATLAHVLAPPIVHVTGSGGDAGGWLWLVPWSGAAMGVTWTVLVAATLLDLWWPRAA